jgi:putative SOS response-associated peptidase YedK
MGPNGEEMETATIVTTTASRDIAHLHDRMPVIVPPEAFDMWLDCRNVDALTAAALFVPTPAGQLEVYQVSPAVNRADNDGPELIEPAPVAAEGAEPAASAPPKREKKKDERQGSLF